MKIEALRALALLIFALLLSGCVKNQLLRLEAHDFSKQAIVVADTARGTYLERVQANNELHDLTYAVDGRCIPPRYRAGSPLPPAKADEKSDIYRLCSKLNNQLTYASFDQQLKSVDFVASYVSALAVASAEPEMIASVQFAQAAADFKVLREAMNNSGLGDDRVKAISSLLNAIELASDDASSAEKIRLAFKDHGASAQRQMEALSVDLLSVAHDGKFDRDSTSLVREHIVRSMPEGVVGGMSRRELMEDIHRHELDEWLQTKSLERCEKAASDKLEKYCRSPAAGLMYAASQAHAELSGLIEGNPSDRQRQRAATLAYRQFISVVGVFVGLRASF